MIEELNGLMYYIVKDFKPYELLQIITGVDVMKMDTCFKNDYEIVMDVKKVLVELSKIESAMNKQEIYEYNKTKQGYIITDEVS